MLTKRDSRWSAREAREGRTAVEVPGSAPYSLVVLAKDEAVNIAACLESCASCDDIHVLDSGSEDDTCAIARSMGATVHYHPFAGFGRQRNWAIDNIPVRHDWVLHLDADERLTSDLDKELRALVASDPVEAGFYLSSKLMFMGQWMRYTAGPMYQVRFFHRERLRFVDYGHGQREQTEGVLGTVRAPYRHESFSKGLDSWFDKHNRYSSDEARLAIDALSKPIPWQDLASRSSLRRRRAAKSIALRLPFRAQFRWIYMAVLRRGLLDGPTGLAYISLMMNYERMLACKIRWLKATSLGE